MKNQPAPQIKPGDIDRIVRRDFQKSQFDAVLSLLGEYGFEKWHRESDRVKAAVLKLANGKLDALRRHLDVAKRDYRDVLVAAEYPEYARQTSGSSRRLEDTEKNRIIESDWEQYRAWLEKP